MTLPLFLLFSGLVALGPQVVLSRLELSFSDVEQCGPVNVSFTGDNINADEIPTQFTILPFNSRPITIPIPNASANATGVAVTFLPLAAGTNFIAFLEDSSGTVTGRVSDIIRVLPSSNNDSTCLPALTEKTRRFDLDDDSLSQCENFTVSYDKNDEIPPSVRLFIPRGSSHTLAQVDVDPKRGKATYLLTDKRSREVVLSFSDGSGHTETSKLLTVGGDSSSDESCLHNDKNRSNQTMMENNNTDAASKPSLPRAAIIGIAAGGGGLVVLVILLMILFIVRDRRRKRRNNITFHDTRPEKWQGVRLPPTPPTAASFSEALIGNPPYVADRFASPMLDRRSTLSSWIQVSSPKQPSSLFSDQATNVGRDSTPPVDVESVGHSSLSSIDIQQILDLAVMRELNSGFNSSRPSVVLPAARTSELSLSLSAAGVSFMAPSPPSTFYPATLDSPKGDSPKAKSTFGYTPRPNPGRSRGSPDVPTDPSSSLTLSALFPSPPSDIPTLTSPMRVDVGTSPRPMLRPLVTSVARVEHNPYVEPRTPSVVIPRGPVIGLPANPRDKGNRIRQLYPPPDSDTPIDATSVQSDGNHRESGSSLGGWFVAQ